MFKLVIQDDEGKTTVVPLIRDEITIGRKEGNTIRLTERNVSRRHARILRNNGEVSIEDLGSYNGIRVNNARIAERVALRVSDQVQIGDYKLYLKAEGVEQVDDARTMPIERVDLQNVPTDVVPAVTAAAPTAPIAVPSAPTVPTPVPGALPATKLVGSPNHTLVAVAETDSQGRPVASQAAISALTSPVGYGRLVVLSSNFAGKDFELSRPQMIVGRTDENDIVINHRSISRNHAKVVREPDTGRYTISDLQSSNGVRVNGQDYGKVELRRGDVVDLGHVRLRFVEPGEDFVFSRDAVITDVPETGSKKGLLLVAVLGILVLAGIGVVWMMKGTGDGERTENRATNGQRDIDAGHNVLATLDDAGPAVEAVDAAAATPDDKAAPIRVDCATLLDKRKWTDLSDCARRLEEYDSAGAKDLIKTARSEAEAEVELRYMQDAIREKNLGKAATHLAKIPTESVFRSEAQTKFQTAATQSATSDLRALKNDCTRYNNKARELERVLGAEVVSAARSNVKCVQVAENPDPPQRKTCPNDFKCGANERCEGGKCVAVAAVTPPPNPCDANTVAQKEAEGRSHMNASNHAAALAAFESILKCKPGLVSLAYLSACRARKFPQAKALFQRLPASEQAKPNMVQICLSENFDPR
jgi:ABC transport system ATP-binding/permease protein